MRSRDAEVARLCDKLESDADLERMPIVRMDKENAVSMAQLNHQVGVVCAFVSHEYGLAMCCMGAG